ncbi:hypothetical protein PHYBLDRAFT_73503 [Phycomyces blakesleeanus NRRL 1555(-)]|uniref:Uncharacterized protein n=1 Tax=Phycomyces blakesleeanus (strain ATCC 8743b / DSM 1359 / FGSC 10004 / NBRC 33097 / NRRL 1555) TaxID=763407 RepID=A0A162TXR4_PHYB8|nr:hypothetical protein PHYBLDRAFT_73503 [Phycomyces blakesleeanus NRRL 1555(-)]OAD71852.1 hypothetical protein PHYBLDRAFT_73503 [Phycomyces blakesleeanus NRRL 1555(-)]|eukprot:XP_018289892.1 hypothetical protein PHYBLDRAFT_73503 [Phycomyces blakesleeanus NRRL 1555(-)]
MFLQPHSAAVLFSTLALAVFLVSNLGTTFNSTILPDVYFARLDQSTTGASIRYGLYNSCLYLNGSRSQCIDPKFGFTLDSNQISVMNSVSSGNLTDPNPNPNSNSNILAELEDLASIHKFSIFIMPATILAFVSIIGKYSQCFFFFLYFSITILAGLVHNQRETNNKPIVGTVVSLIGFLCGGAGLALVIVCYSILFNGLKKTAGLSEALSLHWGPSIYLVGAGCGCMLIAFGFFVASSLQRRQKQVPEPIHYYDYNYEHKNMY